jgi:Ice-binding-like/IPTL-CTERM motif
MSGTKSILKRMMHLSLLASMGFAAFLSLAQTDAGLAQVAPPLGLVQQFGALGASGVTAAGTAVVNGDVGSCPTPSITGAGLSTVPPFTIHPAADAVVCQAQIDATAASTNLLGQGPGTVLVAELGGTTRGPGVYSFASTANIAAGTTFTLSGAGVYIFLVASAITANVGSNVALIDVDPCQVFWRVGSDATLNGDSFPGTVIAGAAGAGSVTVGSGANLAGRAVSLTAAVTMPGTGQTIGGCSTLVLAPTTLSTQASPGVTLGAAISDTATLSGGATPTGTITFNLYGPNDDTCTGAAIFTSAVTVSGNGIYSSTSFTPTAAGTYRWIANYSGDANNAATANTCNAANENVVVSATAVPTPVTAVPTLSEWGMIIFMVLVGLMSIYYLRRQRQKAKA